VGRCQALIGGIDLPSWCPDRSGGVLSLSTHLSQGVLLSFVSEIQGGPADAWEEDFRRCLVRKHFAEENVIISAVERMIELDVQWLDGMTLDNVVDVNMSVQIDRVVIPQLAVAER
jgi:hypothetical protein